MTKQEFIETFIEEFNKNDFISYNDALSFLLKTYHNVDSEICDDDIEKIFGSIDAYKAFTKEVSEYRETRCIELISTKIISMQAYRSFDKNFNVFDSFDIDEVDSYAKEIYAKVQ